MYRTSETSSSLLIVALNGQLWALDRSTGANVWKYAFENPHPWTRVILIEGRVIASTRNTVVCLDARTGEQRWTTHGPIESISTLLVTPSQIFITGAGEVAALDEDGRVLWHEPFRGKGLHPVGLAVEGAETQADMG